jgi:hypothetical protein
MTPERAAEIISEYFSRKPEPTLAEIVGLKRNGD